jgi:hypothetical protein
MREQTPVNKNNGVAVNAETQSDIAVDPPVSTLQFSSSNLDLNRASAWKCQRPGGSVPRPILRDKHICAYVIAELNEIALQTDPSELNRA